MDSMEVNKSIAAVLVAGIVFFLTGLVADNLVSPTPLEKSVLDIKGVPAEASHRRPAEARGAAGNRSAAGQGRRGRRR